MAFGRITFSGAFAFLIALGTAGLTPAIILLVVVLLAQNVLQTVINARVMATTIQQRGYKIVSGGTDNHLFLIDLVDKKLTGKDADAALGRANITVNKNAIPNDPQKPFVTSGLRIGTPGDALAWVREQLAK